MKQPNKLLSLVFAGNRRGINVQKSGLADTLKEVPLASIVLETDAPYLTPVPFRGKRNESSYLKLIAEKVAEIKNRSVEEVAAITSSNAKHLFAIH